ncbi:uncharacterized protein LOC144437517 [Glandiceps talaboti]
MASDDELKDKCIETQRKWTSLYNVGNIRMLVELYDCNATMMAPGLPPKVGREGIGVGLSEMRKKIASYHPHAPDEVGRINGDDLIYFTSGFTCYNPDGEPLYPGKGVFMLKKVKGEYLVYTDCFNYNTKV